jgi:competence protein ComEA
MDLQQLRRSPQLLAATACFLLGAVVLGLSLFPGRGQVQPTGMASIEEFDRLPEPAVPTIFAPIELIVYVSGAVERPDVYRLPANARVKDAVLAAGGLRPDAAADQINLAAPLSDASHINIPALSAVADHSAEPATASGPRLLNLNRATAADFENLPGIGPVLAERIISQRNEQGPFKQVEDLRNVSGVGDKLYAQIAPLVTVDP